jgi:hypothetical protein
MSETEKQGLRDNILAELLRQFPALKPKIVTLLDKTFTYELERNNNYTYFIVEYSVTQSGKLMIDWKSAEMTMI